jgi:acyl-CoA synthetase (AMP-forming)/AMP-acid ligase II
VPEPPSNLAELLFDHPFGDDEGLLFTVDRAVTAGEARAAAQAMADELRTAGVGPGAAVAVALPNGPDVITTMVGVWLAGGVFVPVNPRYPDAEVARVLEATDAAAIVRAADDGSPAVTPRRSTRTYDPGVAFVMWTSGTTGAPKAILHTHEAYVELLDRVLGPLRAQASRREEGARPPSPNLIPVSLALNAGIYNSLFGLRAGAPLVIMDRFETREFAELVHRFGIRSTVLPPAAMAMLTADDAITDLGPLRYVRSITAPLSPLQARRFSERFGAVVLNSYGQAEIGEVVGWTAADAKAHPEKVGAIGRPLPGVELRITADDGHRLGTDEIGLLWVRPPNMAAGYATGEELRDRVDADGFVNTGDLARVDADGFLWIEGRAGDLINRGGNKVFPEQVEEVLCLLPGVAEASVVGAPDERLGEVPVAFVVGDATDAELEAICREHLVPYKVPVAFVRVDALPRSEVGKVLRRELVARYAAGVSPSTA